MGCTNHIDPMKPQVLLDLKAFPIGVGSRGLPQGVFHNEDYISGGQGVMFKYFPMSQVIWGGGGILTHLV